MAQPTELLRRVVNEGGEIVSSREVATGPLVAAEQDNRVAYVDGEQVVYRTAEEVRDRKLAAVRE